MKIKTPQGNGFTRRTALKGMSALGIASLTLDGVPAFGAEPTQVRRGGTLTMILEADNKSLDPLFGNSGVDRNTFNLYTEYLMLQDSKGDLQPWLAERWEVANGGKTITFYLRKDVTFQDGTPFNADAAKANLDRLVDPKLKPYPKQYTRELQSIDKVDDYTIRVNLSAPSVLIMPMLACEAGAMMSPKAMAEKGEEFGRAPVGTGPFKVVSRTTGEIVTERNSNYWRKGADGKPLPYLDGIKVVVNGNTTVRLVQMRSNAAQYSDAVSVKDFPTVSQNPGLKLVDNEVGGAFVLSFNLDRPAFANIELRKALSHALDREAMVKVVSQGTGKVLTGIEPPHSWVYDPALKGHGLDLDLAKASYAKSGHSGPITLSISQRDDDVQVAEMVQQMYKRANIDLKIEVLERLAFAAKVPDGRNFEIALSRSPLQRPDVHTQYTFSYSRVATTNYSGFKNEEIYKLVDDALVELDRAKRKQIYVKIQKLVLDNYYQTFLFWNPRKEVASAKLHGIRTDATSIRVYDEMWLEA
jgi:peptide/nickel transport system substrate-binding protein